MKTVIVHEAIFSSTQHVARVVAAALADAGADVLVTEARTTCPPTSGGATCCSSGRTSAIFPTRSRRIASAPGPRD